VWEALHQLIRALNQDRESAAGALLARMPARAEPIRALAYRLYTLCERKGWAEEARAYNELVSAWTSIEQSLGRGRFCRLAGATGYLRGEPMTTSSPHRNLAEQQ
jgi:adenine-specific DNA methylase